MTRRVAVVGGALVVALVVVVMALYRWYNQTPPAFEAPGPGTVRLIGPGSPGARAALTPVTLPDGSTVRLEYVFAEHDQDGRPLATVLVEPVPDVTHVLKLHEGEQGSVGTLSVRVLHIWFAPRTSNEAMDLRVDRAGGSG